MYKYVDIKRNQVYRAYKAGCGIKLNEVTGCVFDFTASPVTLVGELLDKRYPIAQFPDELHMYEHDILFKRAHPNYAAADRLIILNTLSTLYNVKDVNGNVIKLVFYLYTVDFTGSEEGVIVAIILRSLHDRLNKVGLEINVISDRNSLSEAMKIAKPIIDSGNSKESALTTLKHIPITSLLFSPSRHVLSPPKFGPANPESTNKIMQLLGVGRSVFPEMCRNDPLAVENNWKPNDILQFDGSHGYVNWRRMTGSTVTPIDIN